MLRETVKKIPFAKKIYRTFVPAPEYTGPARSFEFSRSDWASTSDAQSVSRARILNILNYTKTSGSSYAATTYPAGYHQIEINGDVYEGQRKPSERLSLLPLDFAGKTVLDIGCNQGGMIFALGDKPKWAIGLDFDPRMVNACNLIKAQVPSRDLNFYVFDIDKDPHELIKDFLPESRVDMVFLLSVCMWVDRWRELIDQVAELTDTLVFESNGTDEQQDEQIAYLNKTFSDVQQYAGQSDDDKGQKRRKFFIAKK